MKLKDGVKTSEFWIGLLLPQLIAILNAVFGWAIDAQVILGMFGLSGMYIGGRAYVKQPK